MPNTSVYVDHIMTGCHHSDQRPGQYMFNHLPDGAKAAVRAKSFDPFYNVTTDVEAYEWMDNHLIFDRGRIIAVFNNDDILWEEVE